MRYRPRLTDELPLIEVVDENPLFSDPNAGDYRLGPGSPCIDAADNPAVPANVTDIDGNPRFVNDAETIDSGLGDCPIVRFAELYPTLPSLTESGMIEKWGGLWHNTANVELRGGPGPDGRQVTRKQKAQPHRKTFHR